MAKEPAESGYIKGQPKHEAGQGTLGEFSARVAETLLAFACDGDRGGCLSQNGDRGSDARRRQAMTLGAARVVPFHFPYRSAPLNRHSVQRVTVDDRKWGPLAGLTGLCSSA